MDRSSGVFIIGCGYCGFQFALAAPPPAPAFYWNLCGRCGAQALFPLGFFIPQQVIAPIPQMTAPPAQGGSLAAAVQDPGPPPIPDAPTPPPASGPRRPGVKLATKAMRPLADVGTGTYVDPFARPITLTAETRLTGYKNAVAAHRDGDTFRIPPAEILEQFNIKPSHLELGLARYYPRIIALYLYQFGKTVVTVPATRSGTGKPLVRDLRATLLRITRGESIAKHLNNIYNNDGSQTSDKIRVPRYGKNYQGARPNSAHLPQPAMQCMEYYVDRDGSAGASALTIGGGSPGAERIWLAAPDLVFYTWNHYGTNATGAARSALTDADIWFVYSWSKKSWVPGLTR
jgi:hypothetical protein